MTEFMTLHAEMEEVFFNTGRNPDYLIISPELAKKLYRHAKERCYFRKEEDGALVEIWDMKIIVSSREKNYTFCQKC